MSTTDQETQAFLPEAIQATPVSDETLQIGQEVKLDVPKEGEALPEAEEKPRLGLKYCPSCGVDLRAINEREIDYVDKVAWLRHVLGGGRFTKVYALYGGRLHVTFRTRTVAESETIFQQMRQDPAAFPIVGIEPAILHRANGYMLTYSLLRIDSSNAELPSIVSFPEVTEAEYPAVEGDTDLPVARAYAAWCQKYPEAILNAMASKLVDFDHLVYTLQQHSDDDSDFWPAIDVST